MRIITLCGCGLGTCFVLKLTAEKALRELGMTATVVPCDIGSSASERADLFLAPIGLNPSQGLSGEAHLVAVRNVVSVPEVKAAILRALKCE